MSTLKVKFPISLGLLLLFVFSQLVFANTKIQVPESIDFAKTITSFRFTDSAESSSSKKKSWSGWLMPNGTFYISGIYYGENIEYCGPRGGTAEVVLANNDPRRLRLIKLAIMAYNENYNQVPKQVRGDFEAGPSLLVQLNQQIANVNLQVFGTDTNNFRSELSSMVQSIFEEQKFRQLATELAISLDKNSVIYTLSNIGHETVTIMLPEDAGSHFKFRPDDTSISQVGLTYLKRPVNSVITLRPAANFKISLALPSGLDLKKGIFIYDNLQAVYNPDRRIVSKPKVQLCQRIK